MQVWKFLFIEMGSARLSISALSSSPRSIKIHQDKNLDYLDCINYINYIDYIDYNTTKGKETEAEAEADLSCPIDLSYRPVL